MASPRVFVSHSHQDDTFTKTLVADLKAAGADVWVDVVNVNRGDFLDRINEALARCQWFVLVITPDALSSPWVKKEMNAAIHLETQGRMKSIVPIVAKPVDTRTIPPTWDTYHRFDATIDYVSALAGITRALELPETKPADAKNSGSAAASAAPKSPVSPPAKTSAVNHSGESVSSPPVWEEQYSAWDAPSYPPLKDSSRQPRKVSRSSRRKRIDDEWDAAPRSSVSDVSWDQPYNQPLYRQPMQPQSVGAKWGPTSMGMEAHIAAGLSYLLSPILPLIFFLIEKTNRFVKFHAMQSIILSVAAIALYIVAAIIQGAILVGSTTADSAAGSTSLISNGGSLISCLLSCLSFVDVIGFLVLWLWGIISAFTGKYQKLPVIGNLAEKWAGGPVQPAY